MAIWLGFVADLLAGDPYWMPHPVRFIGWLINKTEAVLRPMVSSSRGKKIAGVFLVIFVVAMSTLIPWGLLWLAGSVHPYLRLALEAFMVYQILATRCLDVETAKVRVHLENKDLDGARQAISMLVSRDTSQMDEADIAKAAIETMTENIVDGIVSPLFFLFLGGAPLGFAFKAVNTMDSMVGYKNDKYLDFGWAAAKFDDLVNYVPARMTGVLVVVVSGLLGLDGAQAWKVLKRDRRNHASPNSAYSEAPAAGALRIQLGGKASYFGQVSMKPTMGDPIEPVEPRHIRLAARIMYGSSLASLVLFSAVAYLA